MSDIETVLADYKALPGQLAEDDPVRVLADEVMRLRKVVDACDRQIRATEQIRVETRDELFRASEQQELLAQYLIDAWHIRRPVTDPCGTAVVVLRRCARRLAVLADVASAAMPLCQYDSNGAPLNEVAVAMDKLQTHLANDDLGIRRFRLADWK